MDLQRAAWDEMTPLSSSSAETCNVHVSLLCVSVRAGRSVGASSEMAVTDRICNATSCCLLLLVSQPALFCPALILRTRRSTVELRFRLA